MKHKKYISLLLVLVLGLSGANFVQSSFAQQEANVVEVELHEWQIDMPAELPSGTTTFRVTNTGTFPHNFEIEGQGLERVFQSNLQPGDTRTMRVELEPGTYEIYCPVGNHAEQGMRLELTVAAQPGQQASPTPEQQPEMEGTAAAGEASETPAASSIEEFPLIPDTGEGVAQPGGTLPSEIDLQLVRVTDGLIDPVNVVSPRDGSGRLYVVERPGRVRIVQDGQLMEQPFLDISDQVLSAFLEQGLYDIEFHPDYASNGRFFVHYSELLRNGDSMIVEYRVSQDDPNRADPESARAILQIDQPWANHNGGELAFGPDGYLYIGSGDGGWEGDPLEAGQNLNTLLGKILRIDVDNTGGRQYAVPDGNPFAQDLQPVQLFGITEQEFAQIHTEAEPEVWHYGLRNPWKFQFDPETGDLWLPDVGQNHWEEINYVPADAQAGLNFGWDFLMGSNCFPIEQENCANVGVLPVAEYNHDEHGGCAVVGIGVSRSNQIPNWDGIYFAGDYCSGKVWGIAADENDTWQMAEVLDTDLQLTGSGQDADGNLYVTSCNCNYGGPSPFENPPGALWQLMPADQVPQGAETAPTGGGDGQQ